MHARYMIAAALGAAIALGVSTTAISSDHEQSPNQPSAAERAEMMEAWSKTMQPGKHHEWLAPLVGSWKITTKMWWGGPGSEASVTQGESEIKWVLGKRFIQEHMTSEMMMPDDKGQMQKMTFEGIGFTGYDRVRNMYVATWCDNMATYLLKFTGSSPDGKTFTMYGEMDEPMLNVTGRMVKSVTRMVNKDKHVFEVYDLHAGDDYKVMEITYERQ